MHIRKPIFFIQLASVALLLLVFMYAAYPSFYYFTNDDFDHIPLSSQRIFGQSFLYRPVAEYTLYLDHRLWGRNAAGYHLTNILVHLLNVFLVFHTGRLLLRHFTPVDHERISTTPWFAAGLFLIYPFHVEAVFWIIGRGAGMGCTCSLLALIGYMNRHRGSNWLVLSLISFVTGLFVYESVFVVPALVTIMYYFEKGSTQTKMSGRGIPLLYWGIFAIFLCFRYLFMNGAVSEYEAKNFLDFNVKTLVYNLNALIARSFLPPLASGKWFLAAYIVSVAAVLVFWWHRYRLRLSRRLLLTGLLYLFSLIPVLSLGIDTHDTEGDRFLYLPSVFLLVGTSCLLTGGASGFRKRYAAAALTAAYFACFFILFSRQYQFASRVSEGSMRNICEPAAYRTIYAVDLPSQYKGATIFRSGFEGALLWICPSLKFENLKVLSRRELTGIGHAFAAQRQDVNSGIASFPNVLLRKNDSLYVFGGRNLGPFPFQPGKDLLLIWTDSSLVSIR